MQYKRIFKSHYLEIILHANSKRIGKLVEDCLDLGKNGNCSTSRVKLVFYLEEQLLEGKDFENSLIRMNRVEKNTRLISYCRNEILNVETNRKTGVVKATVSGYRESVKEMILYYIFSEPLQFILAYHGFFFLHASMVAKNRSCILIAGPQDCGKSSIALILAKNGYNLLSDDDCFIKSTKSRVQVFPFPTKIGVSKQILKLYPGLAKHIIKDYCYGTKKRISMQAISKSSHTNWCQCKSIIFPRYKTARKASIRRISQREAVKKLLDSGRKASSEQQFKKRFWNIYVLAKEASLFELTYNDNRLSEIPALIQKAIMP